MVILYAATIEHFTRWLRDYRAAWEGRDAAVTQQRDIRFAFDVFAVSGPAGVATWRADFVRLPDQFKVRIEGVLSADFASAGQCRVFREWWHSAESPG